MSLPTITAAQLERHIKDVVPSEVIAQIPPEHFHNCCEKAANNLANPKDNIYQR
jgi:hypothetical protein